MDRLAFNFTQIACHRERYCAKHTGCKGMSAKGSVSRNCALLWLRDSGIQSGVMYFADDDNFYDVRLFDEVRLMVGDYSIDYATCRKEQRQ